MSKTSLNDTVQAGTAGIFGKGVEPSRAADLTNHLGPVVAAGVLSKDLAGKPMLSARKPAEPAPVVQGTELLALPVAALQASPTNPRKHFDPAELQELAASFASVGVIAPPVVRETHKKGTYEVVVGERRWRAAKLAGVKELLCIVRPLTDEQVLRVQIIENLQRKDVNPIEEAEGYQTLVQKGGYVAKDAAGKPTLHSVTKQPVPDCKRIGLEIGKSARYVEERLALARKLLKPVIDAVLAGKIPVSHAIEIARLPETVQAHALAFCLRSVDRWGDEDVDLDEKAPTRKSHNVIATFDALQTWIKHNIHHALASAPWAKDDATLCSGVGSCDVCPRRTGFSVSPVKTQPADQCTDPACYREKKKAYVARKEEELKAAQKTVIKFASDGSDANKGQGVLYDHQVEKVKAGTKGAVQALDVSTGKTAFVKPSEHDREAKKMVDAAKRTDPESGEVKEKPRRPLKEREADLRQRRMAHINGLVRDELSEGGHFEAFKKSQGKDWMEKLVLLSAAYGTNHKNDNAPSGQAAFADWTAWKHKGIPAEVLWDSVSEVIDGSLNFFRVSDVDEKIVKGVAALIGMDWKALEAAAEKELPEPAGWAAERGTPKADTAKPAGVKSPKTVAEWHAKNGGKAAKVKARKKKK